MAEMKVYMLIAAMWNLSLRKKNIVDVLRFFQLWVIILTKNNVRYLYVLTDHL